MNDNNNIIHLEDQKTFKAFCKLSEKELIQAYFKNSYISVLEQQKKHNDLCLECIKKLKEHEGF